MYANFCIIIVTFNPSKEDLENIHRFTSNFTCIIVDNSPEPISPIDGAIMLYHGNQKGIAGAQNMGIRYVMNHTNISYIIFLDQDTVAEENYPLMIVQQMTELSKIYNIAILGPLVWNKKANERYHSVFHHDVIRQKGFIIRREIISSGSCVAVKTLKEIGMFDESLFIDFVDFEWCWRACSKGYLCGISDKIQIVHQVGNYEINFPFGYRVIISSPIRYYYQYRNYLWLCRNTWTPLQWKIVTGIKHFLRVFYFPILVKNGAKCWRYMLRGFFDGLKTRPKISLIP